MLGLLGVGQLFGEEDVIAEREFTTTVTCKSNTGKVYRMRIAEFFRRIKGNDACWKIIKK